MFGSYPLDGNAVVKKMTNWLLFLPRHLTGMGSPYQLCSDNRVMSVDGYSGLESYG